ncbi:MAG: hypothetical protein DMG65_18455 [Candidatus Angelobacter sp. Gp1-AA117]|nr:MAG: hypothetical protein DMG65_18455 [Candidatus Angelobacter sp. Gp1-AA117]
MQQLVILARWEVYLLIGGLFAIILYKILSGSIDLNGLLTGDSRDGSEFFSPGRAQMLAFTSITAFNYLMEVVRSPSLQALPTIPHSTLAILAGSHLVYLGGKARSMLLGSISEYLRTEVFNARGNNKQSE